MRIDATDIAHTYDRQTRAYAEYRTFSTLAGFGGIVRAASISLRPAANDRSAVCSVLLWFDVGTPVRVTARGRHAYDAINRAADRLGRMLRDRSHAELRSS